MSKRNPAIELYRIFMMFCICYLHTFCQGPYQNIWQSSLLSFAVPGFMLISGWFGIRFSVSKVVRLISVAVFVSLVVPLIGQGGGYWKEVLRIWHPNGGSWFLWSYLIVMALACLIEPFFEQCMNDRNVATLLSRTMPLIMVVFGWGLFA